MISKKGVLFIILAPLFLFSAFGCSLLTAYGTLRLQSTGLASVAVQDLKKNWLDYSIYYAGISVDNPSGVLFDPKSDDKRIISNTWIEVKDLNILLELISWIEAQQGPGLYRPALYEILGPDGNIYGYLFTAWDHLVIKAADNRTLWVDDLPMPPYLTIHGGDGMGSMSH